VTYDTIIEFDNPDLKLFPGMTAYVTIPVATVENVLKVPNTALRYKPPMSLEEIGAIYAKYGIESSAPRGIEESSDQKNASVSSNAARAAKRDAAVVWKLHAASNTIEPVKVSLGITDHSYTEVVGLLKGTLKEGDDLIIRSVLAKPKAPGARL